MARVSNRRHFLSSCGTALAAATVPLGIITAARAGALPAAKIYRSPGCACCVAWARHLQREGFTVALTTVDDLTLVKARAKVPEALWSCHTAFIADYVVEGHVPATDIKRLLRERPSAAGLAVPGMPVGSPGMEMGGRVDRYQVILFGPRGRKVFAIHGG